MNRLNQVSSIALICVAFWILHTVERKSAPRGLKPPQEYFESRNFPALGEGQESYQQAVSKAIYLSKKYRSSTTPWTIEGPHNIGGRVTCIAIDNTSTNTFYIGTPAGGIYKTTNAGSTWSHLFKTETTMAIGALAIDPSNNQTIYAGTGDNALSSFTYLGRGIYKSTNGGSTWTNIGLSNTGVITEIIVHPTNPQIIYVAAMGNIYSNDTNKGLYKSTDGGTTWNQVLFLTTQCGVMDVVMDLSHPDTLFATGMHRFRNSTSSVNSGTSTKIYRTYDGGQNWTTMSNGLPSGPQCKISLAMSQNNPNIVYASYCNTSLNYGGLYKTSNSGNSWNFVSQDSQLNMGGFGWYFGGIRLDPNNDNTLYWMGINLYKTTNGGTTWNLGAPEWYTYDVHADKHDLQFINSNQILLATDGGVYRSNSGGGVNPSAWNYVSDIPITQFYEVGYNPFDTSYYYGGAQDNGTQEGSATNGLTNWYRYFGGDGFKPAFDTVDPTIYYVETQNGNIYVTQDDGANWDPLSQSISSNDRCNWNMPYVLSTHEPNVMYTGSYKVYKNSYSLFDSWTDISPDLTDGINTSSHTISSIDQSRFSKNIIYAGTSDANVWVTQNEGTTWTQINTGLPNRYVSCVQASPNNQSAVFLSYWGYRDNDTTAYIYYSNNYGTTWTSIASSSLPNFAINDIWVRPDGTDSSLLIANDGGVYATINRGATWTRVGNNMPIIPVYDIEYNKALKKIFVGTFAMSMQSMPIDSIFKTKSPVINVGLNETNQSDLAIYPNPCTDNIMIDVPGASSVSMALYNNLGILLTKQTIKGGKLKMDMMHYAAGTYYICLESAAGKSTHKIIKR